MAVQTGERVAIVGHRSCSFPSQLREQNPTGRKRWTKNIRRETTKGKPWTPKKSSRVCSAHFKDGKPTSENPDPTENLGHNLAKEDSKGKRKKPMDRTGIDPGRKPRKIRKSCEETFVVVDKAEEPQPSCSHHGPEEPEIQNTKETEENKDGETGELRDHPQCADTFETSNCCRDKDEEIEKLKEELKRAQNEIKILEEKLKNAKKYRGLKYADMKTDKEVNSLTGIPSKSAFDTLFDLMKGNITKLRHWTGPARSTRKGCIFKKSPKKMGRKRDLDLKEEFLITLMKIRLGSTNDDLAQRFKISPTSVSRIFTTWIKLMAGELSCLVYNPSYEVFRKTLPKKFQKPGYSRVRHIIDCTEVFIETPSDPALRASTWSDYKHHNTAKILVSITPNGAFNFVSKAWGGRTSDVHLTRESGFYVIIERNDHVMADRGFTIAEELILKHARLHIPPGKRGQEQFTPAEVRKTKTIANLRVYVEQAIRRLKTFRIIKNELPISLLPNLDDIILVCAAICNLYKPLCK